MLTVAAMHASYLLMAIGTPCFMPHVVLGQWLYLFLLLLLHDKEPKKKGKHNNSKLKTQFLRFVPRQDRAQYLMLLTYIRRYYFQGDIKLIREKRNIVGVVNDCSLNAFMRHVSKRHCTEVSKQLVLLSSSRRLLPTILSFRQI